MRTVLVCLLGALLSGFLFVLALPPISFWPFGWVALVPVLYVARGKRFLVGFLCGIFALAFTERFSAAGFFFADHDAIGESQWITLGCTMFGFVVALTAAFFAELKELGWPRLAGLAAAAVLMEWCLLNVLPVTLALTQSTSVPMHLVASLGGIWGVSFLVWLGNLVVVRSIVEKKFPLATAIGAIALTLVAYLWVGMDSGSSLKANVVLVQSDTPDIEKLAEMSGADSDALAVWPEFGGLAGAPGGDAAKLRQLSKDHPAFVTSFQDGASPLPHNAAALFADGQESERYAKRKLFGGEKNMHIAGDKPVSVSWKGLNVGLSICFDSCFPGMFRQSAAGADLVAIPTIDPPSPYHWMAAMHAAYMPFRAAENGISILRADGLGYSEAVDPSGRVLAVIPSGENSANVSLPIYRRWTLYGQLGDVVLWLLPVVAFWPLLLSIRRKVGNPDRSLRSDEAMAQD